MQPERKIALAVQIREGVLEKGFFPVFIHIGMEENIDKRLQSLIGNLRVLNKIQDGILLLKDSLQVKGQVGLGELLSDIRQGIVRRFITQEAQLAGNAHHHLADAVDFFQDKIFHGADIRATTAPNGCFPVSICPWAPDSRPEHRRE